MIIQSRNVWLQDLFLPAQLKLENGKIEAVLPYGTLTADRDYGSLRILPGMIDIHTHGGYGIDALCGSVEELKEWSCHLLKEGVTSFLPTLVSASEEAYIPALERLKEVIHGEQEAARMLGIHMEGPFLNEKRKGVHPAEVLQEPSVEQFAKWQKLSGNTIRYLTLACENDREYALTRYCREHGVRVSIGHSDGTMEEAVMAAANGASCMTHVYNGMPAFHHRKPGLIGAAMRLHSMYGEIIADGKHSDLNAVHIFFHSKADTGILVTDSLAPKGCGSEELFTFAGEQVHVAEDGCIRTMKDGTLAGSSLKMNEGLRILIEEAMVPVDAAVHACTVNPARMLGIADHKGALTAGNDADVIVLNEDYSMHAVYCMGKETIYQ